MARLLLLAFVAVATLALNGVVDAAAGSSVMATIPVADQLRITATNISTAEGAAISGPIATFSDSNPAVASGAFTATVMWGDDRTSSAGTVSGSSGAFSITASHLYAEEGSYGLDVLVREASGSQATGRGKVSIADAALSTKGKHLNGGRTVSAVVATFSDADPQGTASDYTAAIAWGDGSTSVGVIAPDSSGGITVHGTHTYSRDGTFNIRVRIQDAGGAHKTAASSYTARRQQLPT